MNKNSIARSILFAWIAVQNPLLGSTAEAKTPSTSKPLNVLFMVMDDVGIDQLEAFGYGGLTPPPMPVMNQLAKSGIRFRNHWSMPACSPSRAVFFEGRFPMRTNLLGALGPSDLANSMVSPYEVTVPKLLKKKSYQSALFGKFHLGLQGNSPYGLSTPHALGFDHFYGWLDETGDPSSIDRTAGGIGGSAPGGNGKYYNCGYVPGSKDGGSDAGACYFPEKACQNLTLKNPLNPPGRACRDLGGIFDPGKSCATTTPSHITQGFNILSAHSVNPVVINDEAGHVEQLPPTDPRSRLYRGSDIINEAISWINTRPSHVPWMATVSFATVHTPLQPPPIDLIPANSADTNGLDCTVADTKNQLPLNNQMITAMDTEIGRLLVAIGLAKRLPDGSIAYDPSSTDTMVVLVDDNGSMGYTAKAPFDPTRAKGTPYQTGVWTPLIVAGPLVKAPDRDVKEMTNHADIFQLFGEMAGINVQKSVPRRIDSVPMLPYLKNPNQRAIRQWNFTQGDLNIQKNGELNGPCVLAGGASCSHIPVTKGVCEDNGGIWWGQGASDRDDPNNPGPVPLTHCCEVSSYQLKHGVAATDLPKIVPQTNQAIRDGQYKLVRNFTKGFDAASDACVNQESEEFYLVNQNLPIPKLDRDGDDLLATVGLEGLTKPQQRIYHNLAKKLDSLLKNNILCKGDGNRDGVIDRKDLQEWETFSQTNGGGSSWYDFTGPENLGPDGRTDSYDQAYIQKYIGKPCSPEEQ